MKKSTPLKIKIAKYLFLFTIILMLIQMLFQLVLLEPMYRKFKKDELINAAQDVQTILQDGLDMEELYRISARTDTCVRVIGANGETVSGNMGCILYRLNSDTVMEQAHQAAANPDHSSLKMLDAPIGILGGTTSTKEEVKTLLYTLVSKTSSGTKIILVSTSLTPVNPTVSTLKSQMAYIVLIQVIAILILTGIMNRKLARPLAKINNAAKSLANGKYELVQFDENYQEAQELNQTLKNAAHDIGKADRARQDLLSNISHDLRTPLTMISGYGQMMKELPGEKTDENLQVIIDESTRLTSLVNDLLDLSRLQENRIHLEVSTFDLSALIEKELRKYDVYSMQEGFHYTVEVEPHLLVQADEKRIAQVFNNFMINAINYSANSREIQIRCKRMGEHVKIEVQDFGEGIREDQQQDIWERYYKIDKEHVRYSNGSGIGLSIVKQLLELHQAPYGVISKEGEGSTFWFCLPSVQEDA